MITSVFLGTWDALLLGAMKPLDYYDVCRCIDKLITNSHGAPKPKHVRRLILHCFHHNSSNNVWYYLRFSDRLDYGTPCFKALIVINKLLVDGPRIVAEEASNEEKFFERCRNNYSKNRLVSDYAQFTWAKIAFHKKYPSFPIDFAFNDKIKEDMLDREFEDVKDAITELLNLAEMLGRYGELIFARTLIKFCHVAAVIPLIEQSYGMYTYLQEFIRDLLERANGMVFIEDEIKRFKAVYSELKKFYHSCSRHKHVTEVVEIPALPQQEPYFESLTAVIGRASHPQKELKIKLAAPESKSLSVAEEEVKRTLDESEKHGNNISLEVLNPLTNGITALPGTEEQTTTASDQPRNPDLHLFQVYYQSEASRLALHQAYVHLKVEHNGLLAVLQQLRKDHLELQRQYRSLNSARIIKKTSEADSSGCDDQDQETDITIPETDPGQSAVHVLKDPDAVSPMGNCEKSGGDLEIESRIGSLTITESDPIKIQGGKTNKGPKLS